MKVKVIPARKKANISGSAVTAPVKLRVAAYCRVSTDLEEQESSYEAHGSPSKAAPLDTVPVRTNFRMQKIKEKYADPVKQAEYVYKQIRNK